MVEKEVMLAYTAYDLLRHIIAISAATHKIEPRRISFNLNPAVAGFSLNSVVAHCLLS